METNKVVYDGRVLIDLTDSTVTPESLAEGVIAYDASGERIVGTMSCNIVEIGKTGSWVYKKYSDGTYEADMFLQSTSAYTANYGTGLYSSASGATPSVPSFNVQLKTVQASVVSYTGTSRGSSTKYMTGILNYSYIPGNEINIRSWVAAKRNSAVAVDYSIHITGTWR